MAAIPWDSDLARELKQRFGEAISEASTYLGQNFIVARPDLVHMDRASSQSGADQKRQDLPSNVYTGIWWYARFPDHYAGDGAPATKELGEFDMKAWSDQVATAIRAIKADQVSLRLQNEFYEKSKRPLDTRQ
jgi:creatinine amidohydrolase